MPILHTFLNAVKRSYAIVLAIIIAIAELIHALLGRLIDHHRPVKHTGDFKSVQELINHVAKRDDDIRRELVQHLDRMLPADKDRLIDILVMTLRVEAKKTLVRKRAISLLAFRLNSVGDRLNHIGF